MPYKLSVIKVLLKNNQVFFKLMKWLMFTVLLALTPFVFSVFRFSIKADETTIAESFCIVSSNGMLLLIAVIICARSIEEVFLKTIDRTIKIVLGGTMIILLTFTAFFYSEVTGILATGSTIDNSLVQNTSIQLLLVSIFCGGICNILPDN